MFDLSSNELEVIQNKVNKQFDVIVYDILNKNIILPSLLLPLSDMFNEKSKIYGVFSLIILSVKDLRSFLKSYLYSKQGAPYDTSACFIVEKHKAKCLKRILPRFKLLHQVVSQSKLWQVYLDEARPHILHQLILFSQQMMSFTRQVAQQFASVLMNSVASHCFLSFVLLTPLG